MVSVWKKPQDKLSHSIQGFLTPLFFRNLQNEYSALYSVIKTAFWLIVFVTYCSCCYSEVKDLQSLPVLQHLKVGLTITCYMKGKNKTDFSSCNISSKLLMAPESSNFYSSAHADINFKCHSKVENIFVFKICSYFEY